MGGTSVQYDLRYHRDMRDPKADSCDDLVPAASNCILIWEHLGAFSTWLWLSHGAGSQELGAAPLEGCLGCGLDSILLCPKLVGADVPCEQAHMGCLRKMMWEM